MPTGQSIPQQANSDEHLIELWLHGRSSSTQRAYAADVRDFLAHAAKPLRYVTLGDLQAYSDALGGKAASKARRLASIKSLISFGHRLGYLLFNIGTAVQAPKVKDLLFIWLDRKKENEGQSQFQHLTCG